MLRSYILVPNECHDNCWRFNKKKWFKAQHKERFICISISKFVVSLIFLSTLVAFKILSLYQLFMILKMLCSYLGCFRFWVPTHFARVISPRCDPGFPHVLTQAPLPSNFEELPHLPQHLWETLLHCHNFTARYLLFSIRLKIVAKPEILSEIGRHLKIAKRYLKFGKKVEFSH